MEYNLIYINYIVIPKTTFAANYPASRVAGRLKETLYAG